MMFCSSGWSSSAASASATSWMTCAMVIAGPVGAWGIHSSAHDIGMHRSVTGTEGTADLVTQANGGRLGGPGRGYLIRPRAWRQCPPRNFLARMAPTDLGK